MISSKFSIDPNNSKFNAFALLRRLWRHLHERRRKQVGLLLILLFISAFAEIVSLGAVLPFLGALTAPEQVFHNPNINKILQLFNVHSSAEMVLFLTIVFVIAALVAGAVRMILLWGNARFAFATGADISAEIFRRTLYQPYRIHISRNSSAVLSGITQKAAAASNVMLALLTFSSSMVLVITIMITLIIIDPKVAFLAGLCFGAAYVSVAYFVRRKLLRNGKQFSTEHANLIKVVQEGLGGIRDILIDGTQRIYCNQYNKADVPMRRSQASNMFLAGSPRIAMEAIGMALVAILAFIITTQRGGVTESLPVLGALALGAQRLLPVLQQIYGSWAAIIGNHAPVSDVLDLLDQPINNDSENSLSVLEFKEKIQFSNVGFKYLADSTPVLDDFDLTIFKGERIGIIGGTGCGKSTMTDLLMGLLEPVRGSINIDGNALSDNSMRSWQRCIAHVPQSIYLSDTSIMENIAFGVPYAKIEIDKVRQCAIDAQLSEFVDSLPEGYNTRVGERGVRLSGGQRQRIGIARALYKRAPVLILDEATNALDNTTENAVMNAIECLDRNLTIIIIAHRLTTVRNCDRIIELINGKSVSYSSLDEFMLKHDKSQIVAYSVSNK